MSGLGPSGPNHHGFNLPQNLSQASLRRGGAFPPPVNKPSPAPHSASPYQPQAYQPQQPPQGAYPQHFFNTGNVNGNVPNGTSRAPSNHLPAALNVSRQRSSVPPRGQMPQPTPPPMLFPTSTNQQFGHDPLLSHQQHPGHASHQQHPGHQSHQTSAQHTAHQNHSAHQVHQTHAAHQTLPAHQQHQQHPGHQTHPAHPGHQAHQVHQTQQTPQQMPPQLPQQMHQAHQVHQVHQQHHPQQQQHPSPAQQQQQHQQQLPPPQQHHQPLQQSNSQQGTPQLQQRQQQQQKQPTPQQQQQQLSKNQAQGTPQQQLQQAQQAQQMQQARSTPQHQTPEMAHQQSHQSAAEDVTMTSTNEADDEEAKLLADPSYVPTHPMGEMMSPPPEGGSYPTLEAVQKAVLRYCTSVGYAIVIGRSKKTVPGLKKVLFVCDRAGKPPSRVSPEVRKRKTSSRKCDCPFGFFAIEQRTQWTIRYRPDPSHLVHNHGPSESPSHHPAARKLDSKMVQAVKELKDNGEAQKSRSSKRRADEPTGAGVSETLQALQTENPDCHLLPRDIYNARAAINRNPQKVASGIAENRPAIYTKPGQTPEDRIRADLRRELAKAREDLGKIEDEKQKEIDALKAKIEEKDKLIEKFEMFIDICNQRVIVQRERLESRN